MLTKFKKMVMHLQELQLSLTRSFHSDKLLKNRLVKECSGSKAYRLTRQNVPPTMMEVTDDRQTSTATLKLDLLTVSSSTSSSALVIDRRRYHNFEFSALQEHRSNKPGRRCLVCKKFNCWSTKHSREKRTRVPGGNSRLRDFL